MAAPPWRRVAPAPPFAAEHQRLAIHTPVLPAALLRGGAQGLVLSAMEQQLALAENQAMEAQTSAEELMRENVRLRREVEVLTGELEHQATTAAAAAAAGPAGGAAAAAWGAQVRRPAPVARFSCVFPRRRLRGGFAWLRGLWLRVAVVRGAVC